MVSSICCGRCGCSAQTCLAVITIILALVLGAPFLRGSGWEDRGFVESLQLFERIHINNLNETVFRRDYVMRFRPLLIDLDTPDVGSVNEDFRLFEEEETMRLCGNQRVKLLSTSSEKVLRHLAQSTAFRVLFRLIFGEYVETWFDRHGTYKLEDIVKEIQKQQDSAQRSGLPLHILFLARLSATLASHLLPLAVVFYSSLYVADAPIESFCPSLLQSPTAGVARALQKQASLIDATWLRDWLQAADPENEGVRGASLESVLPTEGDRAPSLFWGGPGSIYYPLHRDYGDGDIFMSMLSGCKEGAVLMDNLHASHAGDQHADSYVEQFRMPSSTAYGIDVFNHPAPPAGSVVGYTGILRPGQVLYMPAEKRHMFKNRCRSSVSVSQRVWKTTLINDFSDFLAEYSSRTNGKLPEWAH